MYNIKTIPTAIGIIVERNRGDPRNGGKIWTEKGIFHLGVYNSERGTGRNLQELMWVKFNLPKKSWYTKLEKEPYILNDVPFVPHWGKRADGSPVLSLSGEIGLQDSYGDMFSTIQKSQGVHYTSNNWLGYIKIPEIMLRCNRQRVEVVMHLLDRPEDVEDEARQIKARQCCWEVVKWRVAPQQPNQGQLQYGLQNNHIN